MEKLHLLAKGTVPQHGEFRKEHYIEIRRTMAWAEDLLFDSHILRSKREYNFRRSAL